MIVASAATFLTFNSPVGGNEDDPFRLRGCGPLNAGAPLLHGAVSQEQIDEILIRHLQLRSQPDHGVGLPVNE
jgi:hypothetical protein